jgi:hypothetical protein
VLPRCAVVRPPLLVNNLLQFVFLPVTPLEPFVSLAHQLLRPSGHLAHCPTMHFTVYRSNTCSKQMAKNCGRSCKAGGVQPRPHSRLARHSVSRGSVAVHSRGSPPLHSSPHCVHLPTGRCARWPPSRRRCRCQQGYGASGNAGHLCCLLRHGCWGACCCRACRGLDICSQHR